MRTLFFSYKETSEKLITTIQDPGFIKIVVEMEDSNIQNYRTGSLGLADVLSCFSA